MEKILFLYVQKFQPKLEYGVPFYRIPKEGEILLAQRQTKDYYDFIQVGTQQQPVLLTGVPTKPNDFTSVDYNFIELDLQAMIDIDITDKQIDKMNEFFDEEERVTKQFKMEEEIKTEIQRVAKEFDKESIEKAVELVKSYRDLQLFDSPMADSLLDLTNWLRDDSEVPNPLDEIEQSEYGAIANIYSALKNLMQYINTEEEQEEMLLFEAATSILKELKRTR